MLKKPMTDHPGTGLLSRCARAGLRVENFRDILRHTKGTILRTCQYLEGGPASVIRPYGPVKIVHGDGRSIL